MYFCAQNRKHRPRRYKMEEIHKQRVSHYSSLFSKELPFELIGHSILYVEGCPNPEINSYLFKHLEATTNIFGEYVTFNYLPAMMDDLTRIVEYNWPGVDKDWVKKEKPDAAWIQGVYQEILSYRVTEAENNPELPLQITESPLLMRYEFLTENGYLFTLFPLQYRNDEQFEELLKAISQESWIDSGIRSSTIVENEYPIDPKDRADREGIGRLTEEINQRIRELKLMGVKDYVIRRMIEIPEPEISPLRITKDYRIFLTDYNNMEIAMPTLSKVVFFFYLRHPEGLRFKELIDYREELLWLYYRISNRGEIEKMEQSIDELVDSTRNSINEKCSRIRAAFVSRFSDDLAKNYYITIGNGNTKRITLDRHLLIDEAGVTGRSYNT